jgi:hypothetical protein
MNLPIIRLEIHTRGWFINSYPHKDDPDYYYYVRVGDEELVLTKHKNIYDPNLFTLVKK